MTHHAGWFPSSQIGYLRFTDALLCQSWRPSMTQIMKSKVAETAREWKRVIKPNVYTDAEVFNQQLDEIGKKKKRLTKILTSKV